MGATNMSNSATLDLLRDEIRRHYLADESEVVEKLKHEAELSEEGCRSVVQRAVTMIGSVRKNSKPTMMEQFLAEYGLGTSEGVALMSLAEALLRVPDASTARQLIIDKLVPGRWKDHVGQSSFLLVNLTTRMLQFTAALLSISSNGLMARLVRMIVQPVVLFFTIQVMKELGRQFVLGRNIQEALRRSAGRQSQGYRYSFDMLGEAARTERDAVRYLDKYKDAIAVLKSQSSHTDVRENPGISVKLSALFSRYEYSQKERVMTVLVPRVLELAQQARAANMSFNIDAEEMDRLELSLDIIETVLEDESLAGWDGFGVVVQAYGPRASYVIDWLYALAKTLDRRIMVRLVKGAYWDAEIKRAQVLGLSGFPVFTRKAHSDISYIACARKLFGMTDRIYPQFATHNAHTVAAVQHLADGQNNFEFQRLHGMGESLYDAVMRQSGYRCRIYAPVGAHEDLLAYLVRRLLENGANSSFVHQIADAGMSAEQIAQDPFNLKSFAPSSRITRPENLFAPTRKNALGWDLTDPEAVTALLQSRDIFREHTWQGVPMISGESREGEKLDVVNPANPADIVGQIQMSTQQDIEQAILASQEGARTWSVSNASDRTVVLNRIAELFESHASELFALVCREAGKTLPDAIAEVREAVDFARFYASEAQRVGESGRCRGTVVCISPWNFPLAIFSGQVLAAIAAGNSVIAKPAEQTILTAVRAVELMYEAGVPRDVLQLLPGTGESVGAALTADPRMSAVCFTGSTSTAQLINRAMANHMAPDVPLIAETGGLNAMIVDSSALLEQVVRDVLASSFQSAGQRCSALRILYVQQDIADALVMMLSGAMDELNISDPWHLETDIGPVIDQEAREKILAYCDYHRRQGHLIKALEVPKSGLYVPPAMIRVTGIEQLEEEIFGPVLHVATFASSELNDVINAINAKGYGLTFGLHTRLETRQRDIASRMKVGNIYINRNQIGAVVGSQPFGGEGLSGTGPKAGGPYYVQRFRSAVAVDEFPVSEQSADLIDPDRLAQAIRELKHLDAAPLVLDLADIKPVFPTLSSWPQKLNKTVETMPGPVGEKNTLICHGRGVVLCLGPTPMAAKRQILSALWQGNRVIAVAAGIADFVEILRSHGYPVMSIEGKLASEALREASGFQAVLSSASQSVLTRYRQELASRGGELIPLITDFSQPERLIHERHICVDTTAAGGNASLIAMSE